MTRYWITWSSCDGYGRSEQPFTSLDEAARACQKMHDDNMAHGDEWGHRFRVLADYGVYRDHDDTVYRAA